MTRAFAKRMLWRLDGDTIPIDAVQTYLTYRSLTSTLVQLGDQQRAYLTIDSCTGCAVGRCEPGCPRDLLERGFHTIAPANTLTLVAQGLARRTFRRTMLAWPSTQARPLDGALLCNWPEARLSLYWPKSQQHRVAALLAVAGEGPEPAELLLTHGWHTHWLWHSTSRLADQAIPDQLPHPQPWKGDLFLLLPNSCISEESPHLPEPTSHALSERLATRLASLLALPTEQLTHSTPEIVEEHPSIPNNAVHNIAAPVSIWPVGPGRMQANDVEALIEQLRTSPIIQGGDEPGITRRRLAHLLPGDFSEYSRQVMYWLAEAGVLAPPPVPAEPFRNPRLLIDLPDEQLAAKLAATPLPHPEEARLAMTR